MQQTEQQHPEIWAEFIKGNVCVTKGVAGFTSIGPNHGIEQENRELKVIGGIVGILDKYLLIAPELSNNKRDLRDSTALATKRSGHSIMSLQGGNTPE